MKESTYSEEFSRYLKKMICGDWKMDRSKVDRLEFYVELESGEREIVEEFSEYGLDRKFNAFIKRVFGVK